MLFSAVLILVIAALSFGLGYCFGRDKGKKLLKQWVEDHACYQCRENYQEQCLTPEEWDHLR